MHTSPATVIPYGFAAVRPVLVERTCPSCHVRGHHQGNDGRVKHQLRCVSCGHVWRGRIRWDEVI
ncbi:MAG: hypothetical protein E2576_14480 [Alcaligenaceae bacterium]|nr:hypothetical protein [Alcaligenaceae bacterium SAGV5]MPS50413.1 hypothetical protein [Alcaligenaceae bacterium SAGV3]MPT57926.1 hypothetical protein [Alcaligenaceae bacterium]